MTINMVPKSTDFEIHIYHKDALYFALCYKRKRTLVWAYALISHKPVSLYAVKVLCILLKGSRSRE
jgi:hypothetical protein